MADVEQNEQALSGLYSLPVSVRMSDGSKQLVAGSKDVTGALQSGLDIYKDTEGIYRKLEPGVSIDKKTGNVKVYAPSSIVGDDWFKEKYANNENLKKLSQAYKMNPDYKYETTDSEGNTVYKTPEEMVADYDNGLKQEFETLRTLKRSADLSLRPVYGDKVNKMSAEDIVIAMTPLYNSGDYRVSSSTVMSLPDFLLNHSVFGKQIKGLSTFNAENGTVQLGDFKDNFWNRNKNKELTAERIQELYQNLGVTLKYSNWDNVVEDDYERHGSNQAAREIALRNFIQAEDPQADFWLKAGDVVTSVVGGIGMGLADVSIGVMNFLESVNNFLTPGDVLDSQVVKKTAEGWDSWKEYNNEQLELISNASAAITNIAELGTELVANIYIGNLAAGAVGAGVGEVFGAIANKAQLASTSGLGRFMTGVMAGLEASNDAKQMISSAISTQKLFARGGQLVGSAANIMTQAVVDATLTNPVLFRKAIDGDGGEEAYNYLREQAAWNVLGWGLGIGATKVLAKVGDTKFGRAVNAKMAKGAAKLKTVGYHVSDTLKGMISHRSLEDVVATKSDDIAKQLDNVTAEMEKVSVFSDDYYELQKRRTQLQNETLRKETEAFAKADIDIFDGLSISEKSLKEAEDYIINLKSLQNAIDIENRSLKTIVAGYDDVIANPQMAGLNNALFKNTQDIINAEKQVVTQTGTKFTKVAGTGFSQEASNYIGATIELRYMESVIANPEYFEASTVASAKKNIDSYRTAIEDLTKKFSPEMKDALDAYIENGKRWYASMNQYRKSRSIINSQDLEDLLQNPQFSEGDYMRVQRLKDDRYPIVLQPDGTRKTNVSVDFQHLEFAEMSDFMAPDLVQEMYKFKTARLERNYEVLKIRNSVNSATSRVIVSGEDTQFVKDLKATRAQFNSQADDYAKKVIKESGTFDPKEIRQNYEKMVALNRDIKQTGKEIKKTQGALERVQTKQYRVNNDERRIAASVLSPTEISDMLVSGGKSESGSILQDAMEKYADDPAGFRGWYKTLPDDTKQAINRVRREYNELVGPLPAETTSYLRRSAENASYLDKQWSRSLSPGATEAYQEVESGIEALDRISASRIDIDSEDITRMYTDTESAVKRITKDNLQTLMDIDPSLEDTINLMVLKSDKDLIKSQKFDDLVIENKRANEKFIKEVQLADQRGKIAKLVGEQNVDNFMDNLIDFSNNAVDNYVTSVKTDPKMKKYIETLAERSGCSYDDAARYLALSSLKKNEKLVIDQIKASFGKADGVSFQLSKQVENAFNNILDNALDQSRLILGNNDLVSGNIYDEVKKLAQKIDDSTKAAGDTLSHIIATTDDLGRKVFIEVDPATATLFKSNIDFMRRPEGPVAKANKLFSKFFRFGTTGVNLSSTMRQWFRDTQNAVDMGGAFRTLQSCSGELVDELGERIVSQLSEYDYAQFAKRAEETGESIEQLAVGAELRRSAIIAGQTTEAELYTESLSRLDKMKNKANKAYEKVEDIFNNKREMYLRKRVYANNFTKALEQGKTLEQARIIGEFAMNNATTNFSRKLVHLQRVADSTPYFSAAINGSKSFWRMVSLDPVGIGTRIMAGLVAPQIAFTISSLADPKNKEVYENLPEYVKSDNLVFVQNGIAITIPIPQELSFIVAPFRQFVEHLWGVNKNNAWELAMNDIIGVSPINLTGFTTVDMDDMIADPTVLDRLGRGVSRLFSQVAPVPIKSTYMVATGIDPYTGKRLRDSSWQVWNEDTQSFETMDYNQSSFAKLVAGWFGKDTNVTIADKVLSGIFGNTGMDILDTVISVAQRISGDEAANPLSGVESQLGQVGGSLTGADYNMLDSEWRRAIAQLEDERDAIIHSKEMEAIQNKLAQTDNEEEYQKLVARRKDLLADWQKRVASTVTRLEEQGGIFDRYKFAAVVQLLNMNSQEGWTVTNKYLQNLSNQNYYAGLNEAYKTLNEIGIDGAGDYSIFGYVRYRNGEPEVVYNSPTAIVNTENVIRNASDVDAANINALIKKADLYDQRAVMYKQTDAIYDKGKLSQADYNKIDAIKMEFNNRVMATLAPYMEKVSAEAIINNEQVMDVLENLIQVPSAYEKVGNQFVSSGGGKLNKQQGFVRSYIKAILKESK